MNTQNMKKTSVIAVLAIASIVLTIGLSQTENIQAADAPKGNAVYVFAEGVYPRVTFEFRDQVVTYDFQLFDMSNNLFGTSASGFTTTRTINPEFTLTRVVGDTPYLHQAVDQTYKNGGKSIHGYDYKEFDVTVELVQAGQSARTMEYSKCAIANYKISTRTDNEEGYTTGGKTGFSVVETYTFGCLGFTPTSPLYDTMIAEKQNRRPYQ
jgi:hypothetical protein